MDTCSVASLRKIGKKMGYKNLTGDLTKDVLIKRLLAPSRKKMLQMTSELVDKEPQKKANLKQRLQRTFDAEKLNNYEVYAKNFKHFFITRSLRSLVIVSLLGRV